MCWQVSGRDRGSRSPGGAPAPWAVGALALDGPVIF